MATTFTPLGPLVLAGSGEYTSGMDRVDSWLVERCKGTVLLIATSCAQEGADVMKRWEQMGVKHFAKFGVEATPSALSRCVVPPNGVVGGTRGGEPARHRGSRLQRRPRRAQ